MDKNFKIICPSTPNFIRVVGVEGSISISDFSEEELREIGQEWTEELVRRAKLKLDK